MVCCPEIHKVEIDQISIDPDYYPGYHVNTDRVEAFFHKTGYLPLVLLCEIKGMMFLLSGGKRLDVLKKNNMHCCYAFIYRVPLPFNIPDLFWTENEGRFINSAEISNIVMMCEGLGISPRKYVQSRIDNAHIVSMARTISAMDSRYKDFLAKNAIPFHDLKMINYISPEYLCCLIEKLLPYKINGFKLKEVLFNFYKAGLLRGFPFIIDNLSTIKCPNAIMKFLYDLCNPFMSKKKNIIGILQKQLKRDYKMDIILDQNFERPTMDIRFNIGDLETIKDLAGSPGFIKLISEYHSLSNE